MSRLDTFVAPRPSGPVIRAMSVVNRLVMLQGLPGFRDIAPFDRVAGLRGVANVRHIDFPESDRRRLASACGPGKATFVTPNHPEFFTDWMIDKEIASGLFPNAAFWATNAVVNGTGRAAQRFWLANNLIAQIPGNNEAAREHSIDWALKGHGVLLHPEGSVGWHSNALAPFLPGAFEMAQEALRRGRERVADFEAWIAPVVWKLVFTRDMERELLRECAYVERKLRLELPVAAAPLPLRILAIYEALLARDEDTLGLVRDDSLRYEVRQEGVLRAIRDRLTDALGLESGTLEDPELLRLTRRRLRETDGARSDRDALKRLADRLARVLRLGSFAFASQRVTQEELAEHLKRIRNDYCHGTLRDTMNRFVPQPAGPRRAFIRAPKPIAVHGFVGTAMELMTETRRRMLATLDEINADLAARGLLCFYDNPFFAEPPRSR